MGSRFDGALGATALDVRLDLAAMLAHSAAGSPAIRPGVFPGCSASLVTGTSGWAYQVDVADFATTRGGVDGAHIFSNGAAALVATDSAPGTAGSSRVDVIYVLHPSKGENADTSSTPIFGVAKGNPSTGTPAVPAIPTGALALAQNVMTAAATSTASAGNAITQVFRYTALRGAPVVVRTAAERNELNATATATSPVYADRLDTGNLERSIGAGWSIVASTPVDGAVTYGPALDVIWRAPTSQAGEPITLVKRGTEVTMRGGAFENSAPLTLPATGQNPGALTIPTDFAPTGKQIATTFITVAGTGNLLGSLWVMPDGTCTFQTAAPITGAATGSVSVALGGMSWKASS